MINLNSNTPKIAINNLKKTDNSNSEKVNSEKANLSKVELIKKQIESGEYKIDLDLLSNKIADTLI